MESGTDQKKCILILGMHRTGTSALSGALHSAGLSFGSNLVPALENDNDKGFFEEAEIVRINEDIYKALGLERWDYNPDFPENWWKREVISSHKEEIKSVLKKQFVDIDMFGLKDPRIAMLLPLYLEIFNEINVDPVFIRTYRSPFEVCKSLKDRNGMDYEVSFKLFEQHYKSIEKYTKGKQVLEIWYRDLLKDPEEVIYIINDFAESNLLKVGAAKEFIEDRLNRHGIDYSNELEKYIEFFELEQRKKLESSQKELHKVHKHTYYLENLLSQAQVRIKNMEQSIAWRCTQLIQSAVERVAPLGTRRNEMYKKGVQYIQKMWDWLELRLLILPRVLFHKLPKKFDWKIYLELNPDIKRNGITSKMMAIIHWKAFGIQEGRMWQQNTLHNRREKSKWDWPENNDERYIRAQEKIHKNKKNAGVPRKKIVYLVHQFYPRHYMGTEKFVFNTARLMQQRGYDVMVITHAMKGELRDSEKDGEVLYRQYKYKGIPVLAYTLENAPAGMHVEMETPEMREFAWKTIVKEAPDIVHVGHPMRLTEFIRAAQHLKIPYVMTLTDFWMKCGVGIMLDSKGNRSLLSSDCKKQCCKQFGEKSIDERMSLSRDLLEKASGVYSPSQFLADTFMKEFTDIRVDVIHHGIDQSGLQKVQKEYTKKSSITFFYGGGIQFHKGIQVLAEAFTQVDADNIKLVVYGSGSIKYTKLLEDLARIDKRVELKGVFEAEDVGKIFKEIDVAIVPSIWWENYPLIIHEALVSGVSVITSNIGGMAEKIKDGKTGFTFEVGNRDSLAQVIQSIADDPTILNPVTKYLQSFTIPHPIEEIDQYDLVYKKSFNA